MPAGQVKQPEQDGRGHEWDRPGGGRAVHAWASTQSSRSQHRCGCLARKHARLVPRMRSPLLVTRFNTDWHDLSLLTDVDST